MRFRAKMLSCAIALALGDGSTGGMAWAAGTKANTKPLWLSNNTSDESTDTAVAGKKQGKFLALWKQFDQTHTYLWAQYIDQGLSVGEKFQLAVADGPTRMTTGPRFVAADAQGDAVACWLPRHPGRVEAQITQISCRLIPANSSTTLATPTFVVNEIPSQVRGLSVAMDDDGDFIIAWQAYDDESKQTPVMARRFAADGAAKETAFLVAENSNSEANWYYSSKPAISVAMDQSGDAVVVWKYGSIWGRKIDKDSSGEALPIPFRIDRTPEKDSDASDKKLRNFNVDFPAVAMDETGNFAVAWEREQEDTTVKTRCSTYEGERHCVDIYRSVFTFGIFAQRFDANSGPQNRNKKTSEAEDLTIRFAKKQFNRKPDVAMDANGNFIVAWDNNGIDVFARKYNKPKNKLERPKYVSSKRVFDNLPSVALMDNGSYEVGWTAEVLTGDDSYSYKAMARYFPAGKK